MRETAIWGGNLEIHAIAQLKERSVILYDLLFDNLKKPAVFVRKTEIVPKNLSTPPIFLRYIRNEKQYQAIVLKTNIESRDETDQNLKKENETLKNKSKEAEKVENVNPESRNNRTYHKRSEKKRLVQQCNKFL